MRWIPLVPGAAAFSDFFLKRDPCLQGWCSLHSGCCALPSQAPQGSCPRPFSRLPSECLVGLPEFSQGVQTPLPLQAPVPSPSHSSLYLVLGKSVTVFTWIPLMWLLWHPEVSAPRETHAQRPFLPAGTRPFSRFRVCSPAGQVLTLQSDKGGKNVFAAFSTSELKPEPG